MFQLLAVCPMGLAVVAKEIQELGYDTSRKRSYLLKAMKVLLLDVTYGYVPQTE